MVHIVRKYFMKEFCLEVGVCRRQIERYLAAGWLKPVGCTPGGRFMWFTDAEVKLCRERGQRLRGSKHAEESTTPTGTTPTSDSEKASRSVRKILRRRRVSSRSSSSKVPTYTGPLDFMY